jgi:hypothetical protein
MREVGEVLRSASDTTVPPATLGGLAGTIISRTRAERDQSWRGVFRRATEDWHWFLVGAGSVTATFVCTSLLSMLLTFGPKPEREDSLAGLMADLSRPSGCMFLVGSVTDEEDVTLLSMDDNCHLSSMLAASLVLEAGSGVVREADLVNAVVATLNRSGRFVLLENMAPEDRRRTELWLDQLLKVRLPQPVTSPAETLDVDVHQVRMFTNVTAKL